MTKKRLLILAVIVVVLGVLVYFQVREWRHFNWTVFWRQTGDTRKGFLLIAVLLIFATYVLRALRWKIFLKPICHAAAHRLISPTFIGFTGLALLGRPGEFARPYLIARKENLTVSSQMAVWAVERIFDIGAFAVLMSLDIFLYGDELPFRAQLHEAGYTLMSIVLVLAAGAFLVRRNSTGVANWFRRRFEKLAPEFAHSIAHKMQSFGEGLNTIHGPFAFLQLSGLSLAIWFLIALTYRMVMLSYHSRHLHQLHVPQVLLLMGSSMVGSLIQLPAVGGGSQLAVISMLNSDKWFSVPKEVATSAGIMLWLVTFMAVIPVGLFFAHREHVSLTRITAEATKEEQAEAEIVE
jgi:uncharacterized protein (TIRG00374 family)